MFLAYIQIFNALIISILNDKHWEVPWLYLIIIVLVSPSVSRCHSEPYFTQFSSGLVLSFGVFLFIIIIFSTTRLCVLYSSSLFDMT